MRSCSLLRCGGCGWRVSAGGIGVDLQRGTGMTLRLRVWLAVFLFLLIGDSCVAQTSTGNDRLAEEAHREFVTGKYSEAERHLSELAKRDPSNIYVQTYLGHTLFRQEKYAEAVVAYEKARDLERGGKKLSQDEHRI